MFYAQLCILIPFSINWSDFIRILTGCYDNTVHLWNIDGTHHLTIPGHCGPVKGVHWVETLGKYVTFVRYYAAIL